MALLLFSVLFVQHQQRARAWPQPCQKAYCSLPPRQMERILGLQRSSSYTHVLHLQSSQHMLSAESSIFRLTTDTLSISGMTCNVKRRCNSEHEQSYVISFKPGDLRDKLLDFLPLTLLCHGKAIFDCQPRQSPVADPPSQHPE